MGSKRLRICNAMGRLWAYDEALKTQVRPFAHTGRVQVNGVHYFPNRLAPAQEKLAALCQHSTIPDTLLLLEVGR